MPSPVHRLPCRLRSQARTPGRPTPGPRRLAVLLLGTVMLAACGESVIGSDRPAAAAGSAAAAAAADAPTLVDGGGVRAYPCRASQATPGGPYPYRYGSFTLRFPRAALARDGSVVQYRVRWQAPGMRPVAAANCLVPRTEMAISIAARFFGAQHGIAVRTGRRRDGQVTTMGCVKEGQCSLDAIDVVVAPSPGDGTEDPCARGACWDRDGTDGSSGGWSGYDGGSTSSDPGTPGEPPAAEDDAVTDSLPPDCTRPQPDIFRTVYCQGHLPTPEQRMKLNGAMARMRQKGGECAGLADAFDALLAADAIHVFDDPDRQLSFSGAAPPGGDWAELSSSWFTDWETTLSPSGRNLASTIAHEMDHHLNHVIPGVTDALGHLLTNGTTDPNHTANSRQCAV
jgi:hypothetical protein